MRSLQRPRTAAREATSVASSRLMTTPWSDSGLWETVIVVAPDGTRTRVLQQWEEPSRLTPVPARVQGSPSAVQSPPGTARGETTQSEALGSPTDGQSPTPTRTPLSSLRLSPAKVSPGDVPPGWAAAPEASPERMRAASLYAYLCAAHMRAGRHDVAHHMARMERVRDALPEAADAFLAKSCWLALRP